MKTALVSPCYLEGKDPIGNNRVLRNQRYLNYYLGIQKHLGFHQIVLFDNASSYIRIDELLSQFPLKAAAGSANYARETIGSLLPINLIRFENTLERGPGPHDYPYCWRALYAIYGLINLGFEKIITIDSDGFVLTKRMASFIRNCNTGWQSFWCENGQFPESSIHILNSTAFSLFTEYTKTPWVDRVGSMMERALPFSDLNRDFRVSRFGERAVPPEQDPTMDMYCQAPLSIALNFEGK